MTPVSLATAAVHVPDLRDFTLPELTHWIGKMGEPSYRARQIFRWLWRGWIQDFGEMTDLPRACREALAGQARLTPMSAVKVQSSRDGTRKILLGLSDGEEIEAVLIPEARRLTACISSQVGCAMGCRFCLTATMGLHRNLRPSEIAGQLVALQSALVPEAPITHIVLMGMGEPLANYVATEKALHILTAKAGLGFSPRRITVSTVGLVPGIRRLARSGLGVNLAVSLSATTDDLRDRLIPINARYPLSELLQACREFPLAPRRRITFEYVLMADVNDSVDDARRLARLLKGIQCKVNLIPLNEAPGLPFHRPPRSRTEAFRKVLERAGHIAPIRESRGQDISAACGMLATAEGLLDSPRSAPYTTGCGVEQSGSSLGS